MKTCCNILSRDQLTILLCKNVAQLKIRLHQISFKKLKSTSNHSLKSQVTKLNLIVKQIHFTRQVKACSFKKEKLKIVQQKFSIALAVQYRKAISFKMIKSILKNLRRSMEHKLMLKHFQLKIYSHSWMSMI